MAFRNVAPAPDFFAAVHEDFRIKRNVDYRQFDEFMLLRTKEFGVLPSKIKLQARPTSLFLHYLSTVHSPHRRKMPVPNLPGT